MYKLTRKLSLLVSISILSILMSNTMLANEPDPKTKPSKSLESKINYPTNYKVRPMSESSTDNYTRVLKLFVSDNLSEAEIKEITDPKCQEHPVRSRAKYQINVLDRSSEEIIKIINCSDVD